MPASILLATTMTWPYPAQLAGAFAGVGAQVEALCPPRAMLARSRHVARLHRYHALAPMESLSRAIAAARPDMIIPCDDLAAEQVSRIQGSPFIGRMEFLTRAANAGAPSLAAAAVENEDQLEDVLRRFGLPLVVKSDHSWGGDGVAIAATRQEARAAFRRLKQQSRLKTLVRMLRSRRMHLLPRLLHPVTASLSAQAFVEGPPATSSIACWQGEVVAALHFDVLLSTTPTSPASLIAAVQCPQMQASARAVASAFHLSGLFGLDYIRGGNGKVHLLEMNARATPTSHLALDNDLPAGLLAAAKLGARARPPVTGKPTIALFPREWLRDPASPWLTEAFHDVPWDDPEVVRACVQAAPAAAPALLKSAPAGSVRTKSPVFGD